MKQEKDFINSETFDISLDEFDALEGNHEFSKEYEANKKSMLKEYRKRKLFARRNMYGKVAVALLVILLSAPIVVKAATDKDFFGRLWGNSTRENIKEHEEVIESNGEEIIVTYPEREYVTVDEELASLIGDYVYANPIVKEIEGTTLTMKSAVEDEHCAVVEFTLEKEGGVDVLEYDQLYNEDMGAWFKQDASFSFGFKEGLGNIYVDMKASTKEKLVCYYYMVKPTFLSNGTNKLTLEIRYYPFMEEYKNYTEEESEDEKDLMKQFKQECIEIPIEKNVSMVEFAGENDESIYISPISMNVDLAYKKNKLDILNKVNIISNSVAADDLYKVEINYKDGSKYTVYENSLAGVYTSDKYIDNTSYICGVDNNTVTILFNRLVDVNNIEFIVVNDSVLKMKE